MIKMLSIPAWLTLCGIISKKMRKTLIKISLKSRKHFSLSIPAPTLRPIAVKKRGIKLRNNFHLKFKDWKDKEKYSQKSFEGYFSKSESPSQPAAVAIQNKLVTDDDFENEKKKKKNDQGTETKENGREKTKKVRELK